jgi:DNA-binding transcriptional regulator GbsR (MarR family)
MKNSKYFEILEIIEDGCVQVMDAITMEFVQRLGGLTEKWGLSKCTGDLWGILLVSSDAMTQEELVNVSGYSPSMVSMSLSRLEEMGFVIQAGRKNRKRLYVAIFSFVDAWENFIIRVVNGDVTPIIENTTRHLQEITVQNQKVNIEQILMEFEKGRFFMTLLLSLMKKHKHQTLEELKSVLSPDLGKMPNSN